jgi:hypothetical protein
MAEVPPEVLHNLSSEEVEGELANDQLHALLILADLVEHDTAMDRSARASSRRWCPGLTCELLECDGYHVFPSPHLTAAPTTPI